MLLTFSTIFSIYLNFRSQITYPFVKCDCSIYCFPQFCKSDMSRYGYLEVFQRVLWNYEITSQLYTSLTSPIESGMCPTIWVNVVPVNKINLYNTQGGKRVLIPYLSISIYEQQRPRPACAYVQSNHISLDKAFF